MKKVTLGLDVGTVSAKWALIGPHEELKVLGEDGGPAERIFDEDETLGGAVAISRYKRLQGKPVETVLELLDELFKHVDVEKLGGFVVTGSGGRLISKVLDVEFENEFKAAAVGVGTLYPEVENIFEMGGENSKYIRISNENGTVGIADYETNGDCAAGTGSFMDQQATRLKFRIEEVGEKVLATERAPKIAGRCSVFAKSDMIHAQQKGYKPEEVLKGLCEAVARNFKSNIARGKNVAGKTAFIGGVALNKGVANALRDMFKLEDENFIIPEAAVHIGAIGAAKVAQSKNHFDGKAFAERFYSKDVRIDEKFPSWRPLSREKVVFLRDRVDNFSFEGRELPVDVYLGIDVGSVSTNLAVIDDEGHVVKEIYLRTRARPIEVVNEGLQEIEREIGDKIRIRGVGTTGSGRELIGELIGADTINDEITAHKTGAHFISDRYIGKKVDTIFEIGGQDSKFISIDKGIVVDFTMNEACAAGTGSFLEEQAEKLDISIINEFAELAFSSEAPIRLGERCTVYMEQDVTAYMKKGAAKNDIVAGLAYSVVQNYLNRVVRGRRIGEVIFFQGGTAYNDAVAAAFSAILDKTIIVPPYNGVIGAIGAALLAKEKANALDITTKFRGYDLNSIDYSIREFTCKGCSNYCDIQEFTVEGQKTYWGDKCSDRFRKRAKVPKKPVIPDLMVMYDELLERDAIPLVEEKLGIKIDTSPPTKSGKRPRIGFPRAMYFFERFPFWNTYFNALGFEVVLTPKTNKKIAHLGVESVVAEPCFPMQVAHGHTFALLEKDVDRIFIPNVVDAESDVEGVNSYMCPWGQTLPYVLRSHSRFEGREEFIAAPMVHFRESEKYVEKELWDFAREYGVGRKRHKVAVRAGFAAQTMFTEELERVGAEVLQKLDETGEVGIILVGRPYNVMDREVNLDVPSKLRDYYGVNVIPIFYLPIEGIGITDVNDNMFWNYGRKILRAARLTAQKENLHLIYITNFKCGPDSYVKHFTRRASEKPFLTLQFDGHGNDAGIMTRCEAYLDSKGVLRWWKRKGKSSKEEPSTSQECLTEEQEPLRQLSNL